MAFRVGSFVMNVVPVQGRVMPYQPERHPTDPRGPGISGPPGAMQDEEVTIPPNRYTGEVTASDDLITYVIYPLHSTGNLQPHLIKAEGFTSDFRSVARKRAPFVWQPTDYRSSRWRPVLAPKPPK